jgi:hypothetical protein
VHGCAQRVYTEGAVLDEHIDSLGTHVISLILNIGQTGVREPWPLTIKDVHGERHSVLMEPGDMVLYESSKCQHGRPLPFEGDSFTNMFVHYKPKVAWSLQGGLPMDVVQRQ